MTTNWIDKQYGKNGIGLYLINIFILLSPCIVYFLLTQSKHLHETQDTAFTFYFFGSIFLYVEIRNALIFIEGKTILQSIMLDEDKITGQFFYGRKIEFKISDIKSFDYYPLTWQTKWSNFLDAKSGRKGIDIVLKTGEMCRISPCMEDFSGMVTAFKKLIVKLSETE